VSYLFINDNSNYYRCHQTTLDIIERFVAFWYGDVKCLKSDDAIMWGHNENAIIAEAYKRDNELWDARIARQLTAHKQGDNTYKVGDE